MIGGKTGHYRTEVTDPMDGERIVLYLWHNCYYGSWERWSEAYQADEYGAPVLCQRMYHGSHDTQDDALRAQERMRDVISSPRALG